MKPISPQLNWFKAKKDVTKIPTKMKKFKILIVDDNDFFRETLKATLLHAFPKASIKQAENGLKAMLEIGTFVPDLIFMDIQLNGVSGLDLTKKIKASHPKIAIIILTMFDIPEYRRAASDYGADRFLAKSSLNPLGLEVLVRTYQKAPAELMMN